jgi:hypothetical protein
MPSGLRETAWGGADLGFRNYAKTHPDLCILAVNTFVQVDALSYYLEIGSWEC